MKNNDSFHWKGKSNKNAALKHLGKVMFTGLFVWFLAFDHLN